jgi:hypothetical protein
MKALQPYETELIGNWIADANEIKKDDICKRIEWLIKNTLKKAGYSKEYGAWEILYIDPEDGRYWVKTYPKSHMHGGGPPTLKNVPRDKAVKDFDLQK